MRATLAPWCFSLWRPGVEASPEASDPAPGRQEIDGVGRPQEPKPAEGGMASGKR